jgi:membrane peptidoglycan carboxypeptidase
MSHSPGPRPQAVPPRVARLLTGMMQEVVRTGTGTRAALPGRPAAGKTGTTQAARDAWFVGYTADYVAGVWMGYDDNTPLTGVTGGGLPAEIWRETMLRLHEGLPSRALDSLAPAEDAMPRDRLAGARDRSGGGLGAVGGALDRIVSGVAELLSGAGGSAPPVETGPRHER